MKKTDKTEEVKIAATPASCEVSAEEVKTPAEEVKAPAAETPANPAVCEETPAEEALPAKNCEEKVSADDEQSEQSEQSEQPENPENIEKPAEKKNSAAAFFKSVWAAIAGFFIWLGDYIKDWFNEKIVKKFKGDEEHRSFKQWLKDIGLWFKKFPSRFVAFFKGMPAWFKALPSRTVAWFKSLTKENVKAFFFGTGEKKGFLPCLISYTLLILFGFVYVYPVLYMIGYSLMSPSDVTNPMVNYLPTAAYFQNYTEASQVLKFWSTLFETIYVSLLPAIFQTVSCCLAAYGLARFKFFGKKVVFALIIITFIVPTQLTMMPQVLIYSNLGIIDSVFTFIIPAALGQGIKSAVFILIFYQFFRGIPDSVVEAAKIDGANSFQIFIRLGLAAAKPAILLSLLLSVVWYYNETVLTSIYLGGTVTTLPLELEKFEATYKALFGDAAGNTGKSVNEAIYMAGTLLSILPLIVFYFFTQKHFTEGIDKAGITGE